MKVAAHQERGAEVQVDRPLPQIFRSGCAQHNRVDDHQVVNTDHWAVLEDSERDQWTYVPRQTIGPLGFGMDRDGAVTAMAERGFTAERHNMGVGTRQDVLSGVSSSVSRDRTGAGRR